MQCHAEKELRLWWRRYLLLLTRIQLFTLHSLHVAMTRLDKQFVNWPATTSAKNYFYLDMIDFTHFTFLNR